MSLIAAQPALQAGLACASKINEKGPCCAFPYGSTQGVRSPIEAPNSQILTCGCQFDRYTSVFRGVWLSVSCLASLVFVVQSAGQGLEVWQPVVVWVPGVFGLAPISGCRPPQTSFKKRLPVGQVRVSSGSWVLSC